MLGNSRLIVDTHCEIYRELKDITDDIFWELDKHEFESSAIYVIGRQQFRTHYARIKSAAESNLIRVIFSNPHEGSETIRWQLSAYGIDELVKQGQVLVLSGGDVEPELIGHFAHENFVSKCFAYPENIAAQQHTSKIFNKEPKPFRFLFLNGRCRWHRKRLIDTLSKQDLLKEALWSNLDTGNGDLHYLPLEYEVERFSSNVNTPGTGFVKNQLFGTEWGDIYINPAQYTDTYFSIVTETVFDYPHSFRTEKIWKPIFMGHPFIAVANTGYLRDLHALGFKTFGDLVDETWDTITDNSDRLARVEHAIIDLCSSDLDEFLVAAEATCKYNQQHMLELSRTVNSKFPQNFLDFVTKHFNE